MLYEEPLAGGWYVCASFAITAAHHLELAEVKVFPGGRRERFRQGRVGHLPDPGVWADSPKALPLDLEGVAPGGITARLLREIRVNDLLKNALALVAQVAGWNVPHSGLAQGLGELPVDRPGRAGRDDRFYIPWALRYDQKVAEGSRKPVSELAQEGGFGSRDSVRDVIHECRVRQLLTKAAPGRPGGRLTAKARALAEEMGLLPPAKPKATTKRAAKKKAAPRRPRRRQ